MLEIKKINNKKIYSNNKNYRLDKFIQQTLYKKNGYYIKEKPIGKRFDFITSPEISQTFGEIIGAYLIYHWKEKINSKFNLIELGPGNGTLFKDIARSAQIVPSFLEKANITFVEINKQLREFQKKNLNSFKLSKIKWSKSLNFKSNLPSVIYSNEFFDCFPVRQFVMDNDIWFEKYVNFNNKEKKHIFVNKKVINKKLIDCLKIYKKQKIYEVSFSRNKYFEEICTYIKKNRGICILVDYGYYKNIKNFTLQSVFNHKISHIFENIGKQDISSHVNFSELIKIAKEKKLSINEYNTQRNFLIKHGILERIKKLNLNDSHLNKDLLKSEVNRLIDINGMGKLFKCLVVSNL